MLGRIKARQHLTHNVTEPWWQRCQRSLTWSLKMAPAWCVPSWRVSLKSFEVLLWTLRFVTWWICKHLFFCLDEYMNMLSSHYYYLLHIHTHLHSLIFVFFHICHCRNLCFIYCLSKLYFTNFINILTNCLLMKWFKTFFVRFNEIFFLFWMLIFNFQHITTIEIK